MEPLKFSQGGYTESASSAPLHTVPYRGLQDGYTGCIIAPDGTIRTHVVWYSSWQMAHIPDGQHHYCGI